MMRIKNIILTSVFASTLLFGVIGCAPANQNNDDMNSSNDRIEAHQDSTQAEQPESQDSQMIEEDNTQNVDGDLAGDGITGESEETIIPPEEELVGEQQIEGDAGMPEEVVAETVPNVMPTDGNIVISADAWFWNEGGGYYSIDKNKYDGEIYTGDTLVFQPQQEGQPEITIVVGAVGQTVGIDGENFIVVYDENADI